LEGIKSFKKLKEGEYDKEIIGSDIEHVSKIYTVKRDDDEESQGSGVSLGICEKTMLHLTMETLVNWFHPVWDSRCGACLGGSKTLKSNKIKSFNQCPKHRV
jgi:hypothetical protein